MYILGIIFFDLLFKDLQGKTKSELSTLTLGSERVTDTVGADEWLV